MNQIDQIYRDEVTLKARRITDCILLLLALCGLLMMSACNRSNDRAGHGQASETVASDNSRKTQDAKVNICEVVTKADAERVLGESVKDPDGGTDGCDYEIADFGVGGSHGDLFHRHREGWEGRVRRLQEDERRHGRTDE